MLPHLLGRASWASPRRLAGPLRHAWSSLGACSLSFLFLVVLGLQLRGFCLLSRRSATWATPSALFSLRYFQHRVLKLFCLRWPQTSILLISASQVAGITDMSHRCPSGNLVSEWSQPGQHWWEGFHIAEPSCCLSVLCGRLVHEPIELTLSSLRKEPCWHPRPDHFISLATECFPCCRHFGKHMHEHTLSFSGPIHILPRPSAQQSQPHLFHRPHHLAYLHLVF
jgi:hypothetical protein